VLRKDFFGGAGSRIEAGSTVRKLSKQSKQEMEAAWTRMVIGEEQKGGGIQN
jgi:hypothetical protein